MVISLGEVEYLSLTITAGTKVSAVLPTHGMSPCGLYLPAAMTSTTLKFSAALLVAGTLNPLYNSSGEVSYTIAAGRFLALNPADFYGIQFIQFKLDTNEAADRILNFAMKGI